MRGDFIHVRLKAIRFEQTKRNGNGAEAARHRCVHGETGIGIENFGAGLDDGEETHQQRHFASGRDEHIFGAVVEIAGLREIFDDSFAERRNAFGRAIAVAAGGERFTRGFDNRRGGMEFRFAEFEMDDRAAGAFELAGARENFERAFAAQAAEMRSQLRHRVPILALLFARERCRRNVQRADEARKEFEGGGDGHQLDDLLKAEGLLELLVKRIVNFVGRAMQAVGGAEAEFLARRKRAGFEIFNRVDLGLRRAAKLGEKRMRGNTVLAFVEERDARGDEFLVPRGQRAFAQQRLEETRNCPEQAPECARAS